MSVHESEAPAVSGQVVDLTSGDWAVPMACRGVLVGTGGVITGQLAHDVADIAYPLPAGMWGMRFRLIRKTGTTATQIVALF
jgi:hypothetical protein